MFWSLNTLSMFLSQVISLMLSIRQRFLALNEFLISSPKDLKRIAMIHLKLTHTIEIMNATYCVMAMFFLAGAFVLLNFFLFCLKFLFTQADWKFTILFLAKATLNTYSFFLNMLVVVAANKTSREAKRTMRILFELQQDDTKDPDWKTHSEYFVEQIANTSTFFTCGLFKYDYKLFFKVWFASKSLLWHVHRILNCDAVFCSAPKKTFTQFCISSWQKQILYLCSSLAPPWCTWSSLYSSKLVFLVTIQARATQLSFEFKFWAALF